MIDHVAKKETDFMKILLVILSSGYGAIHLLEDEERSHDITDWVVLLITVFIRCDILSMSIHENWPIMRCTMINIIITTLLWYSEFSDFWGDGDREKDDTKDNKKEKQKCK